MRRAAARGHVEPHRPLCTHILTASHASASGSRCTTRRPASLSFLRADRIIAPEAPLALRLSGQLMLGIVRIYYKQVEYLAHDANGALSKLRQVRALPKRSGSVLLLLRLLLCAPP